MGMDESTSTNKEERNVHEKNLVQSIFRACELDLEKEEITLVKRIGKYDPKVENNKRPILVAFNEIQTKKTLFKNIAKLRDSKKYKGKKITVSNDLTKEERENEHKLWELAKDIQAQDESGEYKYKVRGPPWARKIVKLPLVPGEVKLPLAPVEEEKYKNVSNVNSMKESVNKLNILYTNAD